MSKIALTPNASGNGVFTITAPNSGTNRAIALPDAAGTIPLLAAASNTAITSTPAELNILDGVTSTAAELNILDGVTSTAAELNILDGVTSTAAELNILDGVTSTAAEINLIDGGTARGTTALADGDGILINDAGTMRMSTVQTVKTYMTAGVGGGGTEFIASSGAISNGTAAVVFTSSHFDASKYDNYIFYIMYCSPVTDAQKFLAQESDDGGSSFYDGSSDYTIKNSSNQSENAAGHQVSGNAAVGNGSNEVVSSEFLLISPHTSAKTMGFSSSIALNTYSANGSKHENDVGVTNGIKFLWTSGNIKGGEISMYGIVNA